MEQITKNLPIENKPKLLDQVHHVFHTKYYSTGNRIQLSCFVEFKNQRTISVCQYVIGDFSYEKRYFHNLQDDEKEQILNYKLTIYLCSGTDSERLDWFRTINIAGEKLTPTRNC